MTGASLNGLFIVTLIAVMAPILVATVRWLRFPAVVVEIVAGIVIGPAGLGWVRTDDVPVGVLSLVGLAFVLFLAGLEIDLRRLTGRPAVLALRGYALTIILGLGMGFAFHVVGWVRSPTFLAVALSATALGLVVPVLKDAGEITSTMGQLTVVGASTAEFGGVVLLAVFFSASTGSTTERLATFAGFLAFAAVISLALAGTGGNPRIEKLLASLQDTTAEIRVRLAVALLIGFVALAASVGLETILGAFVAGAVLGLVDHDSTNHPHFRTKLEAIGFGFVVPVFFIASGVRFDLNALVANPAAIARVPLFVLALLVVHALPNALYAPQLGYRSALVSGLLQATSLPFIVTAASIGVATKAIQPVNAAALIAAGMLSVMLFPAMALGLVRKEHRKKAPAFHFAESTPRRVNPESKVRS